MGRCCSETSKLRYVHAIRGKPRDIAIKEREINYIEIAIVPFIINLGGHYTVKSWIDFHSPIAPFLDLHLSILNGFVSSKIYDKGDDFDFDIVIFPFLDGDVPRSTSYGVYISQLIRFARVSSHVVDFNACNKSLTAKLLQQGYRYHKLRKTFSKFYRRHYELVSKFSVGLKTFLHQGLSEPEFYGDLVYKFKKL